MENLGRLYARFVHDQVDYWGTYPLQAPVEVGDVLEFSSDGSIHRLESTLDWPGWSDALSIEKVNATGSGQYLAQATRKSIVGAAGGITASGIGANGQVELSFQKSGGFVMDYVGAEIERYRSVQSARKWVLELAKNGDWPEQHALVTEVVHADSATVVMSVEQGSQVLIGAAVALPAGGPINLADPSLGLTVTNAQGQSLSYIGQKSTPLYRCVRLRKDWLNRWHAQLLAADEHQPDEAFTTMPFDDDV